ncbi:MAG: hypothetical protein ABSB23_00305 [Bryobacteraceae bacterium]|jgi:hypothetical protein
MREFPACAGDSCFHRVRSNVSPVLYEALPAPDPLFGEPMLAGWVITQG